jgi:hypothetical protein
MDRNHHGAKFSIPVSLLHQLSWKLYIYLYLGFTGLLPEYQLLQAIVAHVLHLLMGRNQSPSKSYIHSQMFYNMEFCEVDIIAGIPL